MPAAPRRRKSAAGCRQLLGSDTRRLVRPRAMIDEEPPRNTTEAGAIAGGAKIAPDASRCQTQAVAYCSPVAPAYEKMLGAAGRLRAATA